MANIIAVIWDFDKTLLDGYMQDPIFEHFGVDGGAFWKEVAALPGKYLREQNVKVNPDTIYLNHFIRCAKNGTFPGLNNAMLREFGKKLRFYPGIPEIFDKTRDMIASDPSFQEFDIRVEHYIVSTGMTAIIEGTEIRDHVDGVWGCEFIEEEQDGQRVISEVGYTIDNTTKTRAIFEINKGANVHPEIDVNAAMAEEDRRVRFRNMIYIADGPSDVPAFSVVHGNGGATFAIYPKSDRRAFTQVEELRKAGRIDMYAEADYREDSQAYMWISGKILEFARRILDGEHGKLRERAGSVPRHLNV